jgi:hypothetical protein
MVLGIQMDYTDLPEDLGKVTTQVSYRLVEKLKNVYGKGVTVLFRAKQTLSDNAACRGYSA